MFEQLTKPFKKFKTLPSEAVILKSAEASDSDEEDKETEDETEDEKD